MKKDKFWDMHLDNGVGQPLSSEFKDLIEKMLSSQFNRITLDQIKIHAWYNQPVESAKKIKKYMANIRSHLN